MKKLLVAILALGTLSSASAFAIHYSWTDFELNQRVMLNLTGFSSTEDASQAAVATIADIEAGNLMGVNKKMRYIGADDDCRDLWNNRTAQAVGEFIARRGQYAKVSMGFTLATSYDSQGNPSVTAKLGGRIPCLAPQDDD